MKAQPKFLKSSLFSFSAVLLLLFAIQGSTQNVSQKNVSKLLSVKDTTNVPKSTDPMQTAYSVSGYMVSERLKQEDGQNEQIIKDISQNDLVVVDGTYDHIHMVLDALKVPFIRISQQNLGRTKLHPHQTVFINCAGSFPAEYTRQLADFVAKGGQLITTDWALKHVLEKAFPGYVSYNDKPTGDEVVRIEVMDKKDPVIAGFLDEKTDPVWWLEGSSYPIKVLNKERVKVLIRSKELKDKYGEDAVLIRFNYGEGTVYHMISHFYLQRTETKDAKQTTSASLYMMDKNVSADKNEEVMQKAKDLNYGTVQSANTSSEFIMRAVINQKKKNATNESNKNNDKK